MEFLVQLFRALANRERIKILRLLVVFQEMNVCGIEAATEMAGNLVSAHLKVLAAAGLVWRRRSGRHVSYRLAEEAGNPVTACVLRMLGKSFAGIAQRSPKKTAADDRPNSPTDSDAALFAFFTAFTHPRRLQAVRLLAEQNGASLLELTTALSMSPRACLRHLAKLERRGLIERSRDGRRTTYVLTDTDGALQRAVFRAVCERLAQPAQ